LSVRRPTRLENSSRLRDGARFHHVDRLAPLHLVPDEHGVGHEAQQRLARQMIPAADRQHGAQTKRLCRAQVLQLPRPDVHERCDEDRIGRLRRDVLLQFAAARQRPLECLQHASQTRPPLVPCEHGKAQEREHKPRRAVARAIGKVRRLGIPRLEETQVVERMADASRRFGPCVQAAPRRVAHREVVGKPRHQPLDHLAATERFLDVDGHVHAVAAPRQLLDRGFEVPQVRPVASEEYELH
jgi:hypothetical protein